MIDAGLVDDVEAIIGTHNNPNYAPGQLAIGVEPMMAGCVKFRVTSTPKAPTPVTRTRAPGPSKRSPVLF